jgi:hypothetical protein
MNADGAGGGCSGPCLSHNEDNETNDFINFHVAHNACRATLEKHITRANKARENMTMNTRQGIAFVPSPTLLYKEGLLTRARLMALESLIAIRFPQNDRETWRMALNVQTGAELKEMLKDEAKRDRQWAARLTAALQNDLDFFAMETARLR